MTDVEMLMKPFALERRLCLFHRPTGDRFTVDHGADPPSYADVPHLVDLKEWLEAHGPEDWSVRDTIMGAVQRPPPEPYVYDPERHQIRIAAMSAKLTEAGVVGAAEVKSTLPGWLRPMEMAVDGIVGRIALHDGATKVRIEQIKEKFGTLRFYISTKEGTLSDDIGQIASWAEHCSIGRCALTGRPGEIVGPGWWLTLSPEMQDLRLRNFDRFGRLLSPDPERRASVERIEMEIEEAGERLEELVFGAERGEEVVLLREGRPASRIDPFDKS